MLKCMYTDTANDYPTASAIMMIIAYITTLR